MPIDRDTAAEVARRHGLSLMDAAGLVNLADDADDADQLARRFAAAASPQDEELRAYAAELFGKRKPDTEAPAPAPPPNVAPAEGTNPAIPDNDRDTRRFVAHLFDHPDRDHI